MNQHLLSRIPPARRGQRGLSIMELMISMAIGLMILTGLTLLFVSSSSSTRELVKSAQQLENGRFAIETLRQDLMLAGFYGRLGTLPAAPASIPDPCDVSSTTTLYNALPVGVQIIDGTATRPSCIPAADIVSGTDIIVVRRASTQAISAGAATINGEIYIQANPVLAQIQTGNGSNMTTASAASGAATTVFNRDGTAAPIRKYNVIIYYVAPCSVPAGGGTACTGSTDDLGKPIPSLKRRYLTVSGGVASMVAETLVEGIQNLQVEIGIDDTPATVGTLTGYTGDGSVDRYSACTTSSACSVADMSNVVAARVYVLARNTETTTGHIETKTYSMGALASAVAPAVPPDAYKRHVYSTEVRIINMAGRRET